VVTASTLPRVLLRGAATVAAGAALMADVGLNEHPTHTVVLALVALVVWALHRRLTRYALAMTALPSVSAALAAQPLLHLAAEGSRPPADAHDHASMLHIFTSDAPVAGMQVVVPAVALIALFSVAHLLYLLLEAVRKPLAIAYAPFAPSTRVVSPIQVHRLGSMLHWCGWMIRAARRGPPFISGHILP
jgi:hypothetical protein